MEAGACHDTTVEALRGLAVTVRGAVGVVRETEAVLALVRDDEGEIPFAAVTLTRRKRPACESGMV